MISRAILIVVMTSSACARSAAPPPRPAPIEEEETLFELIDEAHPPKSPMVRGLWLNEDNARKEVARRKKRALDCEMRVVAEKQLTALCNARNKGLERELVKADEVGRRAEWILPLTFIGGLIAGGLVTGLVVHFVK
jgi:hypothetical protein